MDNNFLDKSDDIRRCMYDLSEADQITDDEANVLQSDDEVFSDSEDELDFQNMFETIENLSSQSVSGSVNASSAMDASVSSDSDIPHIH